MTNNLDLRVAEKLERQGCKIPPEIYEVMDCCDCPFKFPKKCYERQGIDECPKAPPAFSTSWSAVSVMIEHMLNRGWVLNIDSSLVSIYTPHLCSKQVDNSVLIALCEAYLKTED